MDLRWLFFTTVFLCAVETSPAAGNLWKALELVGGTSLVKQFEEYPYPQPYEFEDYSDGSVRGGSSCIEALFNLNRSRTKNESVLRVLIAGGGTGHLTSYLSRSCRDYGVPVSIVHLELSSKSIDWARRHLASYPNLTFVHDSILNVTRARFGEFDYIQCIGVLHHIPDMELAFSRLVEVLKPDGVLHVWINSKYTNDDQYKVNNLVDGILSDGIIASSDRPVDTAINMSRFLLHVMHRRSGPWISSDAVPARIVDSFLTQVVRRLSIEEVYALVAANNARLSTLQFEGIYKPERLAVDLTDVSRFFSYSQIVTSLSRLPRPKQYHFVEAFRHMSVEDPFEYEAAHVFWVTRDKNFVGRPNSFDPKDTLLLTTRYPLLNRRELYDLQEMGAYDYWWLDLTSGRIGIPRMRDLSACMGSNIVWSCTYKRQHGSGLLLPVVRVRKPVLPALMVNLLLLVQASSSGGKPGLPLMDLLKQAARQLQRNLTGLQRLSRRAHDEYEQIDTGISSCMQKSLDHFKITMEDLAGHCFWYYEPIVDTRTWLLEVGYDLDLFYLMQ